MTRSRAAISQTMTEKADMATQAELEELDGSSDENTYTEDGMEKLCTLCLCPPTPSIDDSGNNEG